jgi:hypothetical protein
LRISHPIFIEFQASLNLVVDRQMKAGNNFTGAARIPTSEAGSVAEFSLMRLASNPSSD